MCTAIKLNSDKTLFGRNLDYEHGFGEKILITPRGYNFGKSVDIPDGKHYALIGAAVNVNNYPLYLDAMNETGLCIAGLNFVGEAVYFKDKEDKFNISYYEFIPWILRNCKNVDEARLLLDKTNITDKKFSRDMPVSQLHWIIADKEDCIVIESVKNGVCVYDNPIGVLTNCPCFPTQLFSLNNYTNLKANTTENVKWGDYCFNTYSRGMGAIGLPGDLSSQSRFVRASFTVSHSRPNKDSVNQFFNILDTVKQVRGCCVTKDGEYEYTRYSSCFDMDNGTYFITVYNDRQIQKFDINSVNLDQDKLLEFSIYLQN